MTFYGAIYCYTLDGVERYEFRVHPQHVPEAEGKLIAEFGPGLLGNIKKEARDEARKRRVPHVAGLD